MFVIAVWFMLREIEVAAARVSDMVVSPGLVVLDLPLHKTATGGERTLTRRSLRCAYGAATHPLCPVHAARAVRHLGAAGLLSSAGPLFPGKGGGTRSKEESVSFLRGALEAAGLMTTYQDANGIERQVFGGHACRVAGATFLAARGIPMAVIQLLGRWSSRAIERYTQSAPLALAPSAPSHGLAGTGGPGGGAQLAVPLALADATTDEVQPEEGSGAQLAAPASPHGGGPARGGGAGDWAPRVQFVPAVRPERAVPEADRGPEHFWPDFIYLARTRRVHKPDPDEANAE